MNKTIQRRQPSENACLLPDLHPILAQVYARREISSKEELSSALTRLLPYQKLSGITDAVALLARALSERQRILIVGDFDADGATSSALAVRALRLLGAGEVDYLVPNRFEFGYGLTPEIVAVAQDKAPDLIVTVDNGIASIDGVLAAREAGIDVLITDHHLPGDQLPNANAIVNPNQAGDVFPSKNLAGVGVIFYLMMALRAGLRDNGWFEKQGIESPNLAQLLDLVSLGTVADVVKLDDNNRILVAQGLARIRRGVCCPGIRALAQISGRDISKLVASDMGFALAPRLNAAGRLDDMSLGIECLLTDDEGQALKIAQQLDDLNRERRDIEAEMKSQAMELLALDDLERQNDTLPFGLCLFDESWHQGVIGILASRIKERLHRPVIVFAPAGEAELKGSARSIPGLHIRDVLDTVANRHPDLVAKFGGHAMAAGLSLPAENYAAFSEAFDAEVRRHLNKDDLNRIVLSDGALDHAYISQDVAELLRQAGPWGQGFPEPMFDGSFKIFSQRIVGEKHLKMQLQSAQNTAPIDAIMFNADSVDATEQGDQVHIAYRLDINDFRGQRKIQLVVEHLSIEGVSD